MFWPKNRSRAEETYTENAIRTASREQLLLITYDIVVITQRKSHLSPFAEPPVSCFRATYIRS